MWAEVIDIVISRIQIGNLIFDYQKPSDDGYVEVDITLEHIGLEANLGFAYWFCETYKDKLCADDVGDAAMDCTLCKYNYRNTVPFKPTDCPPGANSWNDKTDGCCGNKDDRLSGDTSAFTYSDDEHKKRCASKDTDTWEPIGLGLSIPAGDGTANGFTTNSFLYQRFRFYPSVEKQAIFPGRSLTDADVEINNAFRLTWDTTGTHEGGSSQTTGPITNSNSEADVKAAIKTALEGLSNFHGESKHFNIGHHGNRKGGDWRYEIHIYSDGQLYTGANTHLQRLPLLQVVHESTGPAAVEQKAVAERKSTGNSLNRGPPVVAMMMECPSNYAGNPSGEVGSCVNVVFDDLEFSGGITATVANWLQEPVTAILQQVVAVVVLRDLVIKDLLIDLFKDLLTDLNSKFFDSWVSGTEAQKTYPPLLRQSQMLDELRENDGYNRPELPRHKVDLFNLTDPDNVYMGYVQQAVDSFINYELDEDGNPPNYPNPPRKEHIKLNKILERVAANATSGLVNIKDLDMTVMNGTDKFTRHHLQLKRIGIGGLNTFTLANVLNPVEKFTLENVLKLERLSVEFDMKLEMWPADVTDETVAKSTNDLVTEEFHIAGLRLSDVTIDLKMLTAIDEYLGAGLKAGAIYDNPVGCLPQAFHELNITYFNITAGSLSRPYTRPRDIIDEGTTVILNALAEWVFESYGDMLLWLMPEISQTQIKNLLQGILDDYSTGGNCVDPSYNPVEYIDYQKEELVQSGLNLLYVNLLDDMTKVNDLIKSVTQDGSLQLMSDFAYENVVPLGPSSELGIDINLFQVFIHNLDTVSKADLLQPVKPFVLRNLLEMGKTPFDDVQLEVHFNLTFSKNINWLDNPDRRVLQNDFVLKLDMDKITFLLEMILKANKERVKNIRLRELMTFDCWYGTLDQNKVEAFQILFDRLLVGFKCKTCDGSQFHEAEARSDSGDAVQAMTDGINKLLKKLTSTLMGEKSTAQLARMGAQAKHTCECKTSPDVTPLGPAGLILSDSVLTATTGHSYTNRQYDTIEACVEDVSNPYKIDSEITLSFPTDLMYAFGALFALLFYRSCLWPWTACCIDMARASSRKQYWDQKKGNRLLKKEEFNMYKNDRSLAFHHAVAPWMKLGVPVALFTCIAMFMLSHTSVLASIDIRITLGGDVLDFKEFQIMMLKER